MGGNATNYFLKDYDLNGNLVWTSFFGNGEGPIRIYANPSGLYVLSAGAGLLQKRDFNGSLAWTQPCACYGITGDSSSIYVVGTAQALGLYNGFLAKYDSSGNQLWSTQFNPSSLNSVGHLEASADSSGVHMAATTYPPNGAVLKYDGNGNRVWSVQLPWITGIGYLSHSDVITVQETGVFVGGDISTRRGSGVQYTAFVAEIGRSSSLIFFGVNPPVSFGLLALLVALATISIIWLRKHWKKRSRSSDLTQFYRKQKIPTDVFPSL